MQEGEITMAQARSPKNHLRLDRVSVLSETLIHILIGGFALLCIIPFIFVVIISFSSEESIVNVGYSFLPQQWSLDAYTFIFKSGDQLWRSYFVSFTITIVGTAISLALTAMYAYALFRKDFKFRKFFTFFSFFTMLFSGGLVPTYMVCRNMLGLHNNYAALIVPLLISPYNFILLRTFFTSAIPDSLIESASIDGSGEYRTLLQIVLPITLPGLATVGLFTALGYWNDWFTALLYITKEALFPLQYLLMKIERQMDFLIQNATRLTGAQMSEVVRAMPRETMRMAMVVMAVLPIACAYPFFQRYFIAGLTVGAVKG